MKDTVIAVPPRKQDKLHSRPPAPPWPDPEPDCAWQLQAASAMHSRVSNTRAIASRGCCLKYCSKVGLAPWATGARYGTRLFFLRCYDNGVNSHDSCNLLITEE